MNMKKKLLSILLTACLVMGYLPTNVFAATTDEDIATIYVGSVQLTVGQYLPSGNDKTADDITDQKPESGGYAYFYIDASNRNTPTLELNDYEYSGIGHTGSVVRAVIYSEGDLALKMTGISRVTIMHGSSTAVQNAAIFAEGSMTVSGEGNLTVNGQGAGSAGLAAGTGGSEEDPDSNLVIEGGKVTIKNASYCINAMGEVTIKDSTVDAVAVGNSTNGIFAMGDVTIENSKVTASTGYGSVSIITVNGDVIVDGSEVNAVTTGKDSVGIEAWYGSLTIKDGTVTANTNARGNGIASIRTDSLTIEGGKLTAEVNTDAGGDSVASIGTGNLTIEQGELIATATGQGSTGIGIYQGGSVNIYGGKVNATGGGSGIITDGLTIEGGELTATATEEGGTGIGVYNTTIKGGELTATATGQGGTGIGTLIDDGSVTISGGTVDADGGSIGIGSSKVTISGGKLDAVAKGEGGAGISAESTTIEGGEVSATTTGQGSAGIGGVSVDISGDAVVNADSTGEESFGIVVSDAVTISGGTTEAQGGAAAFNKMPVTTSSFTHVACVYGNNKETAEAEGQKPLNELSAQFDQQYKYIKIYDSHSPVYATNGAILSAKCGSCGVDLGSVTLKAPANPVYDGGKKSVLVQGSLQGVKIPAVTYCCSGGCSNAGDHTASLTMGDKTAALSFTISKANQAALAITGKPNAVTYGSSFVLGTSGGSGTGAIKWTITEGTGIASISSAGQVTAKGVGRVTVKAVKAGDANYKDTSATLSFTISKANQAALAITGKPNAVTYGSSFVLGTSGGSGTGAIKWTIMEGTGIASISSTGQVTAKGVGRVTVKAVKAGDANYKDTSATYTFTIAKPAIAAPKTVTTRLAKGDYDGVYVSWSKVAVLDATIKYKVQYRYGSGSWKTAAKAATKTSYTIKNLSDGKKVTVRITPYTVINGETHNGKTKNSAALYTLKKLNKPTVKKTSKTKIKVSWNNINGETGYEIYKSAKKNKGFKLAKTVKNAKAKSVTFKTTRNKTYYYKVRAYKNIKVSGKTYKVYGPWSEVRNYKLK